MEAEVGSRVRVEGLEVHPTLHRFVVEEAIPGTGVEPEQVWSGLSRMVHGLGPRLREALERRVELQGRIDQWHRSQGGPGDPADYRAFLEEIGYVQPEGPRFEVETRGVDPEVSEVAGPQLVVPVMNARYALNAANARWGSLYDALYGTDALGDRPTPGPYDPARGARVIAWTRQFLDDVLPLTGGSHADAVAYRVVDAALSVDLGDGERVGLADASAFVGYQGATDAPTSVLLRHHGLHVELVVDRSHPVGRDDRAGIADVVLESAVTAIMDCEDSIAAVDVDDKVVVYRNWLGLMRGDLVETVPKETGAIERRLAPDREFRAPDGGTVEVPGRALMFVRNVGHLMTTDAVLDRDGREISEGFLDAMLTVIIALHDLRRPGGPMNSRAGSVYVVKPKMHGPEEVALADEMFSLVEEALGLPADTVKLGLMDEERRTSVNLMECIRAARRRIAFINTGFLDRTGDEMHTSMEAGPMVRKGAMKSESWLDAYERRNVSIGIACGLPGRAQIGKGMWAAPDLMHDMLEQKIGHPRAGADTAWVPSPTAATLHATHYHRVVVRERQRALAKEPIASLEELLRIPVVATPTWDADAVSEELENNAQGILGYVVRWIEQGIGCSKVPDVHDVALMEDRATCRISSQHIANWLRHGIVGEEQVRAAFRKMAVVVDRQNAHDPEYRPMAPAFDGNAFAAALDLALSGTEQPSGYTEPILHARRRQEKAAT
jgi:malate synthase